MISKNKTVIITGGLGGIGIEITKLFYKRKYNIIIVIQVDGRKRGILEMTINSKESIIIKKSKEVSNVLKYIEGTTIIKNIYIKNKLVNFITKK